MIKGENHIIVLIDAENAFDKIQYSIIIKHKLNIEGNFFNLIKESHHKLRADSVFIRNFRNMPIKVRNEARIPVSLFYSMLYQ